MSDATEVTLRDKYRVEGGRALVSGRQALVRFPLLQREMDRRRGMKTAGYISGYRGSPLGGYDDALWHAAEELRANDIIFHPGLNEDLALTAVAGTQQLDFIPGGRVDGVFGIWYGKGPGVDRSGDAIKHANLQGVAPAGGVVLIYGDDHTGKSSTTAHQSDLTLASWGVPTLYPSTVEEIVEFGLAAVALSRFSGLLVGLKVVNETAEATEAIALSPPQDFAVPDVAIPDGGIHIRPEFLATQRQDMRLIRHKLPLAAAFAQANGLDRITYGSDRPKFVIATAGKAYADVLSALDLLGMDEAIMRHLGIGVYKIAMIFPLDPAGLGEAVAGAKEIFFVEEKRAHAETQAMTHFYNSYPRPRVSGKVDPDGGLLLPADVPLDPHVVAFALADRLEANFPKLEEAALGFGPAAANLRARAAALVPKAPVAARRPAFCAGCPHNSSTQVPEGSVGSTGIGCHGMAIFHPERNPIPMGHMGAEGASWIGLSEFTDTKHIFQNLGDGTYNHSGSLAIRAAVQAGTTITYKILFNDAVAMTGGQPVEGNLTVSRIVEQVRAEGVNRVVVLSEDPKRFETERLPAGTDLRHRDDLAAVQEQMRTEPGVTVIIYDQVCAAEKRRRRKIDAFPDPDQRIFINAMVCEGCGDCSRVSNCLAIQPLETSVGRKRRIDQSTCNKDFSCVKGFCPSFVTVEGGRPRKTIAKASTGPLVAPEVPALGKGFDMVIAGIGGTGVVTIGAILGMAARIEGIGVNLFDMTGLSQKGGAVFSHVRFRPDAAAIVPARIGPGEANLVLGCDLIAAVHPEVLGTITDRTLVVGNSDLTATAAFQTDRDLVIAPDTLTDTLMQASGRLPAMFPASKMAVDLLGDSIASNMLMLGYAWQFGGIPLSLEAIQQAIELNGKAVKGNLKAFETGRRAALEESPTALVTTSLEEFVDQRTSGLTSYWNGHYARRYSELMSLVVNATNGIDGGREFAWAVARSAYKLMAYKDEYEVARLYSDGRFRSALEQEFEDIRSLKIHLAPPLFSRKDPRTGHPRKIVFGPWMLSLFPILAALKPLRESMFDIFGWTAERRLERDLRDAYLAVVPALVDTLSLATLRAAIEIAEAPLAVRGFGHVKSPSAEALLARLRNMPR